MVLSWSLAEFQNMHGVQIDNVFLQDAAVYKSLKHSLIF